MIWQFVLIWVGISVLTLGTYSIIVYLARTKKDYYVDNPKSKEEWRDEAYQNLKQLIHDGQITLAPHLCLSCANPIDQNFDESPYCRKCYQRLEREGFFEE